MFVRKKQHDKLLKTLIVKGLVSESKGQKGLQVVPFCHLAAIEMY